VPCSHLLTQCTIDTIATFTLSQNLARSRETIDLLRYAHANRAYVRVPTCVAPQYWTVLRFTAQDTLFTGAKLCIAEFQLSRALSFSHGKNVFAFSLFRVRDAFKKLATNVQRRDDYFLLRIYHRYSKNEPIVTNWYITMLASTGF